MKKINLTITSIGFLGLLIMSINAIIDSYAVNMTSAIVVQMLFASMFIGGYISYNKK